MRGAATLAVVDAEQRRDDHSAARRVHDEFEPTDMTTIRDAGTRFDVVTRVTDHQAASRTGPRHRPMWRYRIDDAIGLIGAKRANIESPAFRAFVVIAAGAIVTMYALHIAPRTRRQWRCVALVLAFLVWVLPLMVELRSR
jgi:hypothetical protein